MILHISREQACLVPVSDWPMRALVREKYRPYHDRENGTWTIARWWWEADVTPDAEMLDALHAAAERFARYLRAGDVQVGEAVKEQNVLAL